LGRRATVKQKETEIELFESQGPALLDFSLGRRMKSEVYKRSMNTRHDLLARILDAFALIKGREDQFGQKKRLSSHTSCKVH